jgi:hypothetical protein
MRSAEPNSHGAVGGGEPSYFASLMTVLWKPAFLLNSVFHMLLAFGAVRLLSDDPVGYAYAVAALIAVPIAYVVLNLLYYAMKWDDAPLIQPPTRVHVIGAIGYLACLAIAVALAVNEAGDRARAVERAKETEREEQQRREMMSRPDVQRGMVALQRVRELQAKRQAAGAAGAGAATSPRSPTAPATRPGANDE